MDKRSSDEVALFLDVDGTLIDLAASPSQVIVPAELVADLDRVQQALGGAVALVSGRTIADLDALFDPLQLRAAGVHGAEIRFEPEAAIMATPKAIRLPNDLWRSLTQRLETLPGIFAENKRYSFAIHYRAAPAFGPRLSEILQDFIVAHDGIELHLIEAHLAFELKGGAFHKGLAIAAFLSRAPFEGRIPIFIGDDSTDEAGFDAVQQAGGLAYAVGTARPHVNRVFASPGEVRNWIREFISQMALS